MNHDLHIKAKDLSFRIGNRIVLDALTFELHVGVNWIRGQNGTGKTTLLKLLAGALQPSRGDMLLGYESMAGLPSIERQKIFFSGDDLPDLPWLSAGELIEVYGSIYRNIDNALLGVHLREFRLEAVLDTPIAALSLGERHKLQLSVALAVNASLLLLDEPLNALDAEAVALVRNELTRRHTLKEQVIVLTSHSDPCISAKVFDLSGGTNSRLLAFHP